nr:PREDICTED: beta-galactoside alpha-2,6-sialyltransferase 1-like [Latimeria chalumnae]|eukprot:XP_014352625.1 PREDICTED: beta-galactoside alpha-2,6-sialyltransferase 1-like [Latimeria chalumnae]
MACAPLCRKGRVSNSVYLQASVSVRLTCPGLCDARNLQLLFMTSRRRFDSHDAVLRFNAAKTINYEKDVGTRTTIRLINSQVMHSKAFRLLENPLYHEGVLVFWDPKLYSVSISEWYRKPEFPIFERYLEYRKEHPRQPAYILNPTLEWQLWDLIQENTAEEIQRNPPSSGLLGIILMMSLCREVHVYEYLPSKRRTDLCHYFENYRDEACTMGAWHPLIYEKNLVKRMNQGSDQEIYEFGKVTLPGFSTLNCTV